MVAYQTKIRISKHEIRNSKFRKAFNKNNAVFKGAKYLLLKNRNNIRLKKHGSTGTGVMPNPVNRNQCGQ